MYRTILIEGITTENVEQKITQIASASWTPAR